MYDKVKLWIDRGDVGNDLRYIVNALDEAKEQTNLATGEINAFGSLGNLKVSVYVAGISVIGSLPKYLYGSNIYPLDRHTTKEAIEKISDELRLPMDKANVTGFEFGANFVMRHDVRDYLDRLGGMPRKLRCRLSTGSLYYTHSGRKQPDTFCLYDKIAEARKSKMAIPVGVEDANMLRCEIRFDGRLPHQLNVPEVKASTLSDKEFYRHVMQRYQQAYFSITKLNQMKVNVMEQIKTVSDAFDCFVGILLSQTNQKQDLINDFINQLKEAGIFNNRSNYTRLRKKIDSVANKADLTISDELVKELDDEFKNVGAYI
jgi:hypothetical protein